MEIKKKTKKNSSALQSRSGPTKHWIYSYRENGGAPVDTGQNDSPARTDNKELNLGALRGPLKDSGHV